MCQMRRPFQTEFSLDGMTKQRKTVVLHAGVEGKTYEGERGPLRVRETIHSRARELMDWMHRLRVVGVCPEVQTLIQDDHETISRTEAVP